MRAPQHSQLGSFHVDLHEIDAGSTGGNLVEGRDANLKHLHSRFGWVLLALKAAPTRLIDGVVEAGYAGLVRDRSLYDLDLRICLGEGGRHMWQRLYGDVTRVGGRA